MDPNVITPQASGQAHPAETPYIGSSEQVPVPHPSEIASAQMEQPQSSVVQAATTQVLGALPATPPPIASVAVDDTAKLHPESPEAAEDNDLIEREWVDKAKQIVDRTREDPHLQNKEMNRFKADYLNKRYKKVIKVNES